MTHYRPAPVNQFYQLDYSDSTHRYVKTARRWNNVHNGINFDSLNCMAAEGAVAIDAHTSGRIATWPGGIRNFQSDFVGGIGVDDVHIAWANHFSQNLLCPGGFDWADVMHAVMERRHVALAADYRLVPDAYKLQLPGNFDHALGVDDYRSTDGAILVYDSLGANPRWQPQSSVRAAAEAMALRERGTRSSLFVGLTAARPLILPSPQLRISIQRQKGTNGWPTYREFGLYTVQNGRVVNVEVKRTKGLSADATDLRKYPYTGHTSQELVRVTSGRLAGSYVRSAYVVG